MSVAQDCNLKNEKDQFNQDPRLTTGFKSFGVGTNKFLLSVSADKTEVDFFIALDNSAECFNDISRAVITFDGIKSKGNYKNGGTTNCKGYFHFVFKNQENLQSPLKNLAERKVASIQFINTSNGKKDVVLRPEDQVLLQQLANCVIAQLAALRTDTWKVKPKQ
jgi:hypothetical protein